MTIFDDLKAFLPKRVSLLPAYKVGLVVFVIAIMVGAYFYKEDKGEPLSDAFASDKEIKLRKAKRFFYRFMYMSMILGFAMGGAKVAFDLQFYLDNRKKNADWIAYERYFPTLFR
jgi:hypothetical protein